MTQTKEDDYGPLSLSAGNQSQEISLPAYSLTAENQSPQSSLPAYSLPAGNQSQQTSLPAYSLPAENQSPQSSLPAYSLPAGNQSQQTSLPAYSLPFENQSSLPAYSLPDVNQSQQMSLPEQQTEKLLTESDALKRIVNQPSRPPDCICPAILACLCCFWPTGIWAVVAACMADESADNGDMRKAHKQYEIARVLVILTVAIGFICILVTVIRIH